MHSTTIKHIFKSDREEEEKNRCFGELDMCYISCWGPIKVVISRLEKCDNELPIGRDNLLIAVCYVVSLPPSLKNGSTLFYFFFPRYIKDIRKSGERDYISIE